MNADMLKKLKYGWLTASAVGVLLAAQGAVAADDQHAQEAKAGQMEQSHSEGPSFSEIDQDGDGEANVSDLRSQFEEELAKTDWDDQKILDEFDQDNDQSLNADEFETFKMVLNESSQSEQQAQSWGEQPQAEQQAQLEDQDPQAQIEQQDQQAQMEQQEQQAQMEQQEQQAQLEQEGQQDQQFEEEQFEQQAELETEQEQGQQIEQQGQEWEDQAELEQQGDQEFQTEQDQEFESGQQEYQTEEQQAQQDQQFESEQQQAQAGQQNVDSTLLSMPVDQVAQAQVVNSRGEEIGQVSSIVRDETTGELALIVRSGGILGLGGSRTLVNLAEVSQMDEGRLLWDTMLSEDEIAEMPEHDESQYTEISENEYATLEEANRG